VTRALSLGLDAVVLAVTDEVPRVLITKRDGLGEALPSGPLDPLEDPTLEKAVRGWVEAQTGLHLGYVEQLYTFGDRGRDPREQTEQRRVVSVAYLALVRQPDRAERSDTRWRDVYAFLPWEDWRERRPKVLDEAIVPALEQWVRAASSAERARRRERAGVTFGLGGARWDADRVLERYELLWEVGLVEEAGRGGAGLGRPLALDHRRMVATALGRIRGKIEYRPVVFELLPETFTLLQLQRVVEALAGLRLHKQNFRRLVERTGLVEGTGKLEHRGPGRPAELFRFRREVLLERPEPGVGLPGRVR
jgi:hypothetical protein